MSSLRAMVSMLGIVSILALVALYAFQDQLILHPGFSVNDGNDHANAAARSAGLAGPWIEGGAYRGRIHEPNAPEKGTIILYHGNAGTTENRTDLAQVLTSRNFRTVLAEYPGFGEREGQASVNNILSAALEDFRLARARWPGPIYVFGESFGAGVAAEVALRNPDDIAGVALLTPWDSLASLVNAKFFHLPLSLLLHQKFDSARALAAYKGNLVIVAAAKDRLIPVRHARALAQALPAAFYLEIAEADHNSWFSHLTGQDWDRVLEAVSRNR